MKNGLRKITKGAATRMPFPIQTLIRLSGQKLLLPVYHLCSPQPVPHVQHLYRVHTNEEFRADMETLLRYYEPIGLRELLAVMRGEQQLRKPAFWLSFDDGLREVKEQAVPILQELGIPATLFLNNHFLDNEALFYRFKASLLVEKLEKEPPAAALKEKITEMLGASESSGIQSQILTITYAQQSLLDELAVLLSVDFNRYLTEQQPYLTRTEVHALLAAGFTIGGHSLDHPEFRFLSLKEQLRQGTESVRQLVAEFALDYRVFAFPFTDFGVKGPWFAAMLGKELDASFGSAGLKQDSFPMHGQRFPMEGTDRPAEERIRAEYVYYLFKGLVGKNRIRR
jgi:peptidoglycan/xylan/chitin deacetylase (PgdA/CDA1 family)